MEKDKKIMFNFTIDESIKKEFYEVADKVGINKSKLISNLIKKWIEENK